MDPVEILIQKEWNELIAIEKELVNELAADEQEYNLLKKMLQVSSQAAEEVPAVSPQLKEKIKQEIVPASKSKTWQWLSVAASIVVIFLSILLYNKYATDKDGGVPLTQAPNTSPINKPIIKNDSGNIVSTMPSAIHSPSNVDNVNNKKDQIRSTPEPLIPNVSSAPVIYNNADSLQLAQQSNQYQKYIETTVQSDTLLLAYITEIY